MGFVYRINSLESLSTIDKFLYVNEKSKQERIQNIRVMFQFEKEQVNTLMSLIGRNKFHGGPRPLGMELEAILNAIDMRIYRKLFHSRSYIISLLHTMSFLGLLEFKPENKSYDLTSFGLEYWQRITVFNE